MSADSDTVTMLPPTLKAARLAAGYNDAESFSDVLDVAPSLVRAWEDGILLPSEQQLAALWGALQIAFDCDLGTIRNLFAGAKPAASRLAQLVRTAIAVVGLEPEALAALVGIEDSQAEALLRDGAHTDVDLEELSYHVDVDPDDVRLAAQLDGLDIRVTSNVPLARSQPALEVSYAAANLVPFQFLDPHAVTPVMWTCPTWPQHEWSEAPSYRAASVCPHCQAAPPGNLSSSHPELAAEWDAANPTAAVDEMPTSKRRRAWRCINGHRWHASVAARIDDDLRCPECSSLHALRPELSREWHSENRLPASRVALDSTRPAVWRCSKQGSHVWVASPAERVSGLTCPLCSQNVFAKHPPISDYPLIAGEWDDKRDVRAVRANDGTPAHWRCRRGHRWTATPAARVLAKVGCPACERGWDEEALRALIEALGSQVASFSAAELFTLFQQSGIEADTPEISGLLTAVSLGTLTAEDLQDYAAGKPSRTTNILDAPELAYTDDRSLPAFQPPTWYGGGAVTATDDTEAAEFLIASGTARLLDLAYRDVGQARHAAQQLAPGPYAAKVRERFTGLVDAAQALQVPDGWAFSPAGVPAEPNLMQRIVAVRIRDERRIGNWSGTGAGKTVSALLASRVVNADITLITCPNAVVSTWVAAINNTFPGVTVAQKTLQAPLPGVPAYLVVNYEHLQRADAPAELSILAGTGRVGMVVIDEVHQAKQRDERTLSLRRANLQSFVDAAALRNAGLRVLGMSATPVINTVTEGASLLRLVTGVDPQVGAEPSVANCMHLHQGLVRHGIRWMPTYDSALAYQEVAVDCSSELAELRQLPPRSGVLAIEQVLTKARLRALVGLVAPKTLVYTHLRTGIVEQLVAALEEAGYRVGCFTGVDKSGLPGFIDGDVDVLVATSSIATGVDGLQRVCSRVLVNVLPWTDADYTQLKGRVWRQGQTSDKVDFIVPVTYADVDGERWSWCQMKLDRIRYKRSIADAAVDGVVPDELLRSPDQAAEDALAWLRRLTGE